MNYSRTMKRNSKVTAICLVIGILVLMLTAACSSAKEKGEPTTEIATKTNQVTKVDTVEVKPVVADVTEDHLVSLGEYQLTAYCPCSECCGVWGENRPLDEYGDIIVYTASGEQAVEGITIAASSYIPFGTELYINGHKYIVQDRGGSIGTKKLDIYFDNHQKALDFGVQYAEIFIDKRR